MVYRSNFCRIDDFLSSKKSMKVLITRRSIFSNNQSMFINRSDDYNLDYFDSKEIKVIHDKLNSTQCDEIKEIKWTGISLLLFSIITYFFDTGSDCYLMITYYKEKDFLWFNLTLLFVLLPAIVMSAFSLIWYYLDKEQPFTKFGWFIRISLHLLLAAPIVRYIDTLIYSYKTKKTKNLHKKQEYYKLMIYEEADSAMLRILECSMESTPQLLLQLYILFNQSKAKSFIVVIQVSSSIISLISLAWCLTSYQSSLRLTTPGKMKMNTKSMLLMVIWKALIILPRILSIVLFTSVYNLYILFVLGLHYLLMASYIIMQGTTFCSDNKHALHELLFDLVVSFIYCIDYLNLKDGSTRLRYIVYYSISLIEVCVLILFWFFNSSFHIHLVTTKNFSITINNNFTENIFYYQNWHQDVRIVIVICIICCFLLAIVLMCTYYMCCHPSKNKKEDRGMTAGDSLLVNVDSNPTSMSTKSFE